MQWANSSQYCIRSVPRQNEDCQGYFCFQKKELGKMWKMSSREQKYFSVNQYGFRTGQGTEDAIMSLISLIRITDILERGEQCNALILARPFQGI